ncbi:MAG: glutamate racemase [Myxococcota bacterium]
MKPRIHTVGLFDSGVGGLSVAAALLDVCPHLGLLCLGDQAHVPYGGRALSEVAGFARELTSFLFSHGADAVVMACNISSATALEGARTHYGAHAAFGVIEDGARVAAHQSPSGRIGVLATEGTVKTGAYSRTLRSIRPSATVVEVACPRFVPLVEADRVEGPEAEGAVAEALDPIRRGPCDTVILGCTHYPMLLPCLRRSAPELQFVDPARCIAERLRHRLAPGAASRLWTTGHPGTFQAAVHHWLSGRVTSPVEQARWRDGRLYVDDEDRFDASDARA